MFNQMTNEKKQEKLFKVNNIQCFEGASKMGVRMGLRGVGEWIYLEQKKLFTRCKEGIQVRCTSSTTPALAPPA